jgi:hypothetical protein
MRNVNDVIQILSEREDVEAVAWSLRNQISGEEFEAVMEEFRKSPDGRFSDNLLVMLSLI